MCLCFEDFTSACSVNCIKNIFSTSISETNRNSFVAKKSKVLEKSLNIDILKSTEYINVESNYLVVTNKIYETLCYYLKQANYRGYFNYYSIISPNWQHQDIEILPNLLNGKTLYIDSSDANRKVIISIKAITKKVLYSEIVDVKVIYNKINLEKEYEAGTYFITTFADDEQVLFYKRLLFFNEIVSCV